MSTLTKVKQYWTRPSWKTQGEDEGSRWPLNSYIAIWCLLVFHRGIPLLAWAPKAQAVEWLELAGHHHCCDVLRFSRFQPMQRSLYQGLSHLSAVRTEDLESGQVGCLTSSLLWSPDCGTSGHSCLGLDFFCYHSYRVIYEWYITHIEWYSYHLFLSLYIFIYHI